MPMSSCQSHTTPRPPTEPGPGILPAVQLPRRSASTDRGRKTQASHMRPPRGISSSGCASSDPLTATPMSPAQRTLQPEQKLSHFDIAQRESLELCVAEHFDDVHTKKSLTTTYSPTLKGQYHRRSKALTSVLGVPRPRVLTTPGDLVGIRPRAGRVLRCKSERGLPGGPAQLVCAAFPA